MMSSSVYFEDDNTSDGFVVTHDDQSTAATASILIDDFPLTARKLTYDNVKSELAELNNESLLSETIVYKKSQSDYIAPEEMYSSHFYPGDHNTADNNQFINFTNCHESISGLGNDNYEDGQKNYLIPGEIFSSNLYVNKVKIEDSLPFYYANDGSNDEEYRFGAMIDQESDPTVPEEVVSSDLYMTDEDLSLKPDDLTGSELYDASEFSKSDTERYDPPKTASNTVVVETVTEDDNDDDESFQFSDRVGNAKNVNASNVEINKSISERNDNSSSDETNGDNDKADATATHESPPNEASKTSQSENETVPCPSSFATLAQKIMDVDIQNTGNTNFNRPQKSSDKKSNEQNIGIAGYRRPAIPLFLVVSLLIGGIAIHLQSSLTYKQANLDIPLMPSSTTSPKMKEVFPEESNLPSIKFEPVVMKQKTNVSTMVSGTGNIPAKQHVESKISFLFDPILNTKTNDTKHTANSAPAQRKPKAKSGGSKMVLDSVKTIPEEQPTGKKFRFLFQILFSCSWILCICVARIGLSGTSRTVKQSKSKDDTSIAEMTDSIRASVQKQSVLTEQNILSVKNAAANSRNEQEFALNQNVKENKKVSPVVSKSRGENTLPRNSNQTTKTKIDSWPQQQHPCGISKYNRLLKLHIECDRRLIRNGRSPRKPSLTSPSNVKGFNQLNLSEYDQLTKEDLLVLLNWFCSADTHKLSDDKSTMRNALVGYYCDYLSCLSKTELVDLINKKGVPISPYTTDKKQDLMDIVLEMGF